MSDLLAVRSGPMTVGSGVAKLMPVDDAAGRHEIKQLQRDDWIFAEWHRQNAPLGGPRTFDDGRWIAVFAGDLIDHSEVPFAEITAALLSDRRDFLSDLEGIFSIVAYDGETRQLYAVSDRRSQNPLFYRLDKQGLTVSTSLATFVRLVDQVAFNKKWLWETLYFNYPVQEATFLDQVERFPPACVMTFDERSGDLRMDRYAELFSKRPKLLGDREALPWATEVFAKRVSAHYRGASDVACALTGGWDGRTVLALAPGGTSVTAYTYGGPGCGDLEGARVTADAVNVKHMQIPFDHAFVDNLPHHAFETVYLSAGLQGVLRSTLHYMYDVLTDGGRRFPLTVSGISLGTQIRGRAQFPDVISAELARRFQGLGADTKGENWKAILGDDERDFSEHIGQRLDQLLEQFGPFEDPQHHLSYTVYPLSTQHFSGELAVADKFTTVRVPAWDSEIIDLLFSIELSTLTFSQFASKSQTVRRKEMVLQSRLFRDLAPEFYRVPVRGIHPGSVLAGEFAYQLERAYRGVQKRLGVGPLPLKYQPLEDWRTWLFDYNKAFMTSLLCSSDTLVNEFVDPNFVQRTIEAGDMRLVGKLLTTEVILRLIKSRWQRFW